MQGIVVARHCGEQDNVGFGDRLGESRRHADSQIGEFVATELVYGTILSSSLFEGEIQFGIRARSIRSVRDARMVATGRPALTGCRATNRFICSFIRAFTLTVCQRPPLRPYTPANSPFALRRSNLGPLFERTWWR